MRCLGDVWGSMVNLLTIDSEVLRCLGTMVKLVNNWHFNILSSWISNVGINISAQTINCKFYKFTTYYYINKNLRKKSEHMVLQKLTMHQRRTVNVPLFTCRKPGQGALSTSKNTKELVYSKGWVVLSLQHMQVWPYYASESCLAFWTSAYLLGPQID